MRGACVIAVLGVAALAGCGSAPPPNLFTLDAPAASVACHAQPLVEIAPVALPEYADHDQLVRRTAAHQLVLDDADHWAERPAVAIDRMVVAALHAHGRPCARSEAASDAPLVLRLNFTRFEFSSTGAASVAGDWQLVRRDTGAVAASGVLDREVPAASIDPTVSAAGSVAAMNAALEDLATAIAVAIQPPAS